MEKEAGEVVPPELWIHILTFVEDFADVTVLKSVNKLFHVALRPKDPFLILANRLPTIAPAVRKFFKKFDRSYSSISRSELFAIKDKSFKVAIIGAQRVGKTEFSKSFRRKVSPHDSLSLSELFNKTIVHPDGLTSVLGIRDIGGDMAYIPYLKVYLSGIEGVLLCFAIDDESSFETLLSMYIPAVAAHANTAAVVYMLGLKSDIKERKVAELEARALAFFFNIKYFEVSAKDSEQTANIMYELNEDLLKSYKKECV